MKRRIFCALLCALLLVGCGAPQAPSTDPTPSTEGSKPMETQPTQPTQPTEPSQPQAPAVDWSYLDAGLDDQYRNYYEIFVYSFCDSNGDGYGDLNGVTSKLDYIQSMGFNGIWLMPIMASPSYHKYDVQDYYAIDPLYGTMEDFQTLLTEAHKRDIHIIIDLVVNHTSSQHPWFQAAKADPESPYRDYYVFTDKWLQGYSDVGDGKTYYESQFVSTMPDLNLDNAQVRQEIQNIMAYYLNMGVDGFRLDATIYYYINEEDKNIQFLDWLNAEAEKINPDVYIVGEAWTDMMTIARYSESAIDGYFQFSAAQGTGSMANILAKNIKDAGKRYTRFVSGMEQYMPEKTIPAYFLCNHDTGRTASFLGTSDLARLKMGAGILATLPGNVFYYYGDEIGMLGSGADPNKRVGMLWDLEENTTKSPPGITATPVYNLPSVQEQMQDSQSLLYYHRMAMYLRNRNPEIARGRSQVLDCSDASCALVQRTWQDKTILLALNLCPESKTITVPAGYQVTDMLLSGIEEPSLQGDQLTMPGYCVVVLRTK